MDVRPSGSPLEALLEAPTCCLCASVLGSGRKCSSKITDAVAAELLRDSLRDRLYVEDSLVEGDDDLIYPEEVYAVYDGAIYVAVPTRAGYSYHGYPTRAR